MYCRELRTQAKSDVDPLIHRPPPLYQTKALNTGVWSSEVYIEGYVRAQGIRSRTSPSVSDVTGAWQAGQHQGLSGNPALPVISNSLSSLR